MPLTTRSLAFRPSCNPIHLHDGSIEPPLFTVLSRSASRLRVFMSSAPLRHACLIMMRMDQTQLPSRQKRRGKAVTTHGQPSTAHEGTDDSRALPDSARRWQLLPKLCTDMPHLFPSLRLSFNKNGHHRRPRLFASSLPASSSIDLIPPLFASSGTRTPHLDVPLLVLRKTMVSSATDDTTPKTHIPNNISPRAHEVKPQFKSRPTTTEKNISQRYIATASSQIARRRRARFVGLACQSCSLGWSLSPRRSDRPSLYTIAVQYPCRPCWEQGDLSLDLDVDLNLLLVESFAGLEDERRNIPWPVLL